MSDDADRLMTLVEQYAEQSAEYNAACRFGYNEREAGYACQRTEAAIRAHIAEVERAARAAAFREAADIAATPVVGEQDDITMAAKDRIAAALRARPEGQSNG